MGSVPVGRKKRAETAGPQTFRSPTAIIVWWVWLLFAAANLIDLAVQGRDHTSLVAAAILLLATGVAYVTAQRPRIIADDTGITVRNPLRDHHVGWAGVTQVDLADLLRVHTESTKSKDGKSKVVYSWAVHYSRRRKMAAETKARRIAARNSPGRRSSFGSFGTFGLENYGMSRRDVGYGAAAGSQTASAAEAEAERIARVLNEYATAAHAETVWAEGTEEGTAEGTEEGTAEGTAETTAEPQDARVAGWLEPLKSTWNRVALLSLLVPALILAVVAAV